MAKPKGGYTNSVGKSDGTETALPKRVVRHIAIMPSTSCGELKALFARGLITDCTTIQCYEDSSRISSQADFEAMRAAVICVLRANGWNKRQIAHNVRFYDSDITVHCVRDAKKWGKKLDWVYLDYCGVVDFDIFTEIHDSWGASQFSSDAEISVTNNHKLRAASKDLKPVLTALSKYAKVALAYVRGKKLVPPAMQAIVVGTQVGFAYALPFGAVVRESVTYARGMTTTRIGRTRSVAKRPRGPGLVFHRKAKILRTRPKRYRHLAPQEWAWHPANPSGLRQRFPKRKGRKRAA